VPLGRNSNFMAKTTQAVITILMGQCLLLSPGSAVGQSTSALASAKVTVSLEKNVITQHEPAILNITIDSSSTAVDFDPGYYNEKIDIKVVDPEGHVWARPRPVPQEGMKFSGAIHVDPGSTDIVPVLLNDWFSFEKIGDYKIDVTLLLAKHSATGGVGGVHQRLVLAVLPKDEAALLSECSGLLTGVKSSQSYAASLVAAEALSKVDDPIAVPFLAEAIKRREFASLMIAALARLNTGDAVNVLIAASKSSDPETSALAQSALLNLRKTQKQ
jgi:hypothetical protein